MNERIVAQNVLVAGIPGSGKTEYCRWLEREKGFLHLDFDELLTGHGTEEKLALIEQLRRTAEEFVFAISKQGKPIVIDWGFPLGSLSLVRFFKQNGFAMWWFDGDRAAAENRSFKEAPYP
jgi:predicted ABC-type ATPase